MSGVGLRAKDIGSGKQRGGSLGAAMKARIRLAVLFFGLIAGVTPAYADLDQKSYDEARGLGLKVEPNWNLNYVDVVRAKTGYPLFVLIEGEDEKPNSDFIHKAYFKKDALAPLRPVFDFGRDVEVVFSLSGKMVFINDNALSNFSDAIFLPTYAFNGGGKEPETLDKRLGLTFYGVDLKRVIRLSPAVKSAIELSRSKCIHEYYYGLKWLGENLIEVGCEITNCGKHWKGYGHWHCIFNLTTDKIENVKPVKDWT